MAVAAKKPVILASAPVPAISAPTVEKVAETVSAPAADIQQNVRKAFEKGVVETRAAYAKVKAAAEETSGALETSAATAAKGVVEFNTKTLDVLRANAEANFDFFRAVIGVKSLSELVTLQTEHVRKQGEAVTAHAKEISALGQKIAAASVEPIKSQVAKTFKLAV
jgi:phasin